MTGNRLLMTICALLLSVTATMADMAKEPPRKMTLTGTVVREARKTSDGTTTTGSLMLDAGKTKISLRNYGTSRSKTWRTDKATWQWKAKDGKTVDFTALVGKKVKITAMVYYGTMLSSVISVEEVGAEESKPGAVVYSSNPNSSSADFPVILTLFGALVLAGGGIAGLTMIRQSHAPSARPTITNELEV